MRVTYRSPAEGIDALFPSYLSLWEELCRLESPTADKARVDAVGSRLSDCALALGFNVERFPQSASGDVICITQNASASLPPVCLSGHLDTVHPVGSFGEDPVRREGGRLLGPGVTDCKGGVVAALLAMEALKLCGFTKRPLMLLLQTDEEVGSSLSEKATIRYICKRAEGAEAFLNLEGSQPGRVCIARKGILNYRFTVCGVEAHSSACAEEGASAIAEAAHKILALEKMKDPDGLTCNCGLIRGGTTPNTVAGLCEFVANVRYSTEEELALVTQRVREIAAHSTVPGCTCRVEQISHRIAMPPAERNLHLLQRVNGILADCDQPTLEPCKRNGGSDAADVTAAEIPCLDCLGVTGGGIHSPNEFALNDSLREPALRLALIATHL